MYAIGRVALRRAASVVPATSARILSLAVARPVATNVRSSAIVARKVQLKSFSQQATGAQATDSEEGDAVVSHTSEVEHKGEYNGVEAGSAEEATDPHKIEGQDGSSLEFVVPDTSETEHYAELNGEHNGAEADSAEKARDPQTFDGQIDSLSSQGENKTDSQLPDGETPFGLFVRNIVFDATEEHLMEIFGRYGTIVKANIVRDSRGLSRGYGFVYFDNVESMNRAASTVNGSFWHGRRLVCNPRLKLQSRRSVQRITEPTTCLYIGNIPYETTDTELNRMFRELDNIADVRVAVDRVTGWPRGFAHADFHDIASAEKALHKLQGAMLGSRELRIDYAQPPTHSFSRQGDGNLSNSYGGEGQ